MKSTSPVRLDGSQTLAALADSHALDACSPDALLVVECEPGWFALLAAGALQALLPRLHGANNFWLAGVWLNTTLGEFLRPMAVQGDAPAGPLHRRPPNTAEALLIALQIEPDALDYHSQMSAPPKFGETDSLEELAETTGGEGNPLDMLGNIDDIFDEGQRAKSGAGSDEGGHAKGGLSDASADGAEALPVPPPPSKPALQREEIRLDVVSPEVATVNEPFDMAVAIRQPASPWLAVDDLPKLTSAAGDVYRAPDQDVIKYRVEVAADDCEVKPAHYDFLLARGRDSLVQYFQLTPHRAGTLSIVVNAYQAESAVLAATTRVRLKAGVAVRQDASAPADVMKLYEALTALFELDDVQDIAFRMHIKWDELAGDTLSAKCRALLTYCNARGKVEPLKALVKQLRPEATL